MRLANTECLCVKIKISSTSNSFLFFLSFLLVQNRGAYILFPCKIPQSNENNQNFYIQTNLIFEAIETSESWHKQCFQNQHTAPDNKRCEYWIGQIQQLIWEFAHDWSIEFTIFFRAWLGKRKIGNSVWKNFVRNKYWMCRTLCAAGRLLSHSQARHTDDRQAIDFFFFLIQNTHSTARVDVSRSDVFVFRFGCERVFDWYS